MSKTRALSTIALEIYQTWPKVSPYARPYLAAMKALDSMEDEFYFESADSVVRYFLANAGSWRGADARRIKAELKEMAGIA